MDQLFDSSMPKHERIVQLESMACRIEEGKYFKNSVKKILSQKRESF